eukprot:705700-Rhodomonas_salina.4
MSRSTIAPQHRASTRLRSTVPARQYRVCSTIAPRQYQASYAATHRQHSRGQYWTSNSKRVRPCASVPNMRRTICQVSIGNLVGSYARSVPRYGLGESYLDHLP